MRRRQRAFQLAVAIALAVACVSAPQSVRAGTFLVAPELPPCWCDRTIASGSAYYFNVLYLSDTPAECRMTRAAFRFVGLPEGPQFARSFTPYALESTGDAFGEGIVIERAGTFEGSPVVGVLFLNVPTPLAPQTWSIEAHQGMPGATAPLAMFESPPGVWVAQQSYPTNVNPSVPGCDCPELSSYGCPFAVQPETWSGVKRTYD